MKRYFCLSLALFATSVASCQLVAGIEGKTLDPAWSGVDASPDTGADAAVDGTDSATTGVRPPGRPAGEPKDSGKGVQRVFAAKAMFLGTVDPTTLAKDTEAWRKIGHDIDGKCTTEEESLSDNSGVCKKPPGASSLAQEDGRDCIDNASGRMFSGTAQWLADDLELKQHAGTASGDNATLIVVLDDLDEGPDDPYVPARIFVTAKRAAGMGPPIWNGSDEFVLDKNWIGDGGIASPNYKMAKGYLRNNVWVSGDFNKSPMKIPTMLLDRIVEINMATVTLSLTLNAAHSAVLASTISAVVSAEELSSHLWPIFLGVMQCSESAANTFVNTGVKPNADLSLLGNSFVNPSRVCDGISLGTSFLWIAAKMPKTSVLVAPSPDPCADGGSGDAGLAADTGQKDASTGG